MMADWDYIMTHGKTRLEILSERITALKAQLADVTKEREDRQRLAKEIREKLDEFHGHLPPGCWDDIFAALDAAGKCYDTP